MADDLLWHGQGDDVNLSPVNFHFSQAPEILLERIVVFIVEVFFDDRDYRAFRHKTGEIVNMAIGVVPGDSAAEPENFTHTQKTMKTLLDFLATQIRIAIRVEQTRFGREKRAGAVHFNCAAF